MPSSRKKPLSPEKVAEAEALKRLWDAYAAKDGALSQEAFAERYELGTQGNLWQYVNARMQLNLEAAIKFAEGLGCDIADFSPTLAELLVRGRRNDPRLERYEIPDHQLHQLLRDFQDLGRAKRLEFLAEVRAAVLADQEIAKRGAKTDYPTDTETVKALKLEPSRLKTKTPKRRPRTPQMPLFETSSKKP